MGNPIFGMKGGQPAIGGRMFINLGYEGKSFAEVSRFINEVPQGLLDDLIPLWKKIQPIVQKSVANTFATEGRGKWVKLSEAYLKSSKKKKSAYPNTILKLSGRMWRAATVEGADGNVTTLAKDHMVWGINLDEIKYARRHDMCWMSTPQREFMKLFPDDAVDMTKALTEYVRKGIVNARRMARATSGVVR
ncbi:MAG: hypothetical protein WC623_24180 [Pedobacter sp.]|uniref:hypothetical protein n=1 Tax=Pedobacter sp. TaxID=1411316 RepID=UPI003564034B